jgi:hypothetical protein
LDASAIPDWWKAGNLFRHPPRNSPGRGGPWSSTARKSGGALPIDDDGDLGVPLRDNAPYNVQFFHELLSGCEIKSAINTFVNPACDAPAQEIAV